MRGRLVVVGSGIATAAQASTEAINAITSAQIVLCLVADPLTEVWIGGLNPRVESLQRFYGIGKDRRVDYCEMVERVLVCVREGLDVCFVLYGHPGVFAYPGHEAVRRARAEGYSARMLPGISAQDCLFADLGIDPGSVGCLSYDATDFLINRRHVDARCGLVLWQIGVIAEPSVKDRLSVWNREAVSVLVEVLLAEYPTDHEVILYEAARYAMCEPIVRHTILSELDKAPIRVFTTLYVPPCATSIPDEAMRIRLGLNAPR